MTYGTNGTQYELDGNTFGVDEKFVVSTLMAIVYAMKEIHEKELPNLDGAIEKLAGQIYEELKLADTTGTTETTGEGTN